MVICAFVPVVVFFWQRIVNLHVRFHSTLQQAVESEKTGIAALPIARDGESAEEWNVELSEIVLPEQSIHAGSSIAATGLRSQFGCSIVEVERHGTVVSNPRPDFVLYPEDRLLLFGSNEQVAMAMPFLNEEGKTRNESDFGETILESLEVPEDSPRAGRTLAELQILGLTGVQLMGIQRAGKRILSPSGAEILCPSDRILALGTQSELRDLRAWLSEPGWQPS